MKLKAAFIFVAPAGDNDSSEVQRSWTCTSAVDVLTVGVSSYEQGVEAAKQVVAEDGCVCIELCAGFGHKGAAMIAAAVDVPVGVVRFDVHPGLGNVSGDKAFV